MKKQQEVEAKLLKSFWNSSPAHQETMLVFAAKLEQQSKKKRQSARGNLGADSQAISIKVLPSSDDSR